LSAADTPAYAELLRRARETPWEELASRSRRDIVFAQLLTEPERYRGLPFHVEGTLLRVIRQEARNSELFPGGVYYEGYAITPDSGTNPWWLVFEVLPEGVPVSPSLNQPISFDGYFLKLLSYEGGVPFVKGEPRPDLRFRVAPLLVGRFPPAAAQPAAASSPIAPWVPVVIGGLALYFAVRVALQLRRQRRPVSRAFRRRPLVAETIEPEELSTWLEGQRLPAPDEPQPNGQAPSGPATDH
jgi:hypothetical protein